MLVSIKAQLLPAPANMQWQCHSARAIASHSVPLTQRLFCVTSISDSPNESSVEGEKKKKHRKKMALWLVLIALAEPRASVRLGVA